MNFVISFIAALVVIVLTGTVMLVQILAGDSTVEQVRPLVAPFILGVFLTGFVSGIFHSLNSPD